MRKTLTATAVVGAVLVGSAACGTAEQLSAGQKLERAFEQLGREKKLSFVLDLDADAETLKRLDAASDPEPGEEMPDEAAELLGGLTVDFTVESRKPMAESEEKDLVGMAVKVGTPDGALVEYRVVGDHTYVRSDAKALSGAMGMPMPPADELPPEAEGFRKALDGEWITFDTRKMEEAGRAAGEGPGAGPSAAPSLDPKTRKELLGTLRDVVAREVEFTTTGGGGGTEHVIATAPFRTLVTGLFDGIRPLAEKFSGGMPLPEGSDLKDAPDGKVAADFTLRNGALSEVSIDLAELAGSAKGDAFGVSLKLGGGTAVTAPAGATEIDVEELMGFFMGSMAEQEGFEEGFDEEFDEEFDESRIDVGGLDQDGPEGTA
ncbi:hypothetical protein [Streptomyces termitum]|uniref:hypothetical protein n=1 Tax=Streptomyces termitum TaxID=67368 RepID=UPI0037AD9CBE